jgi:hypothetical protein
MVSSSSISLLDLIEMIVDGVLRSESHPVRETLSYAEKARRTVRFLR